MSVNAVALGILAPTQISSSADTPETASSFCLLKTLHTDY